MLVGGGGGGLNVCQLDDLGKVDGEPLPVWKQLHFLLGVTHKLDSPAQIRLLLCSILSSGPSYLNLGDVLTTHMSTVYNPHAVKNIQHNPKTSAVETSCLKKTSTHMVCQCQIGILVSNYMQRWTQWWLLVLWDGDYTHTDTHTDTRTHTHTHTDTKTHTHKHTLLDHRRNTCVSWIHGDKQTWSDKLEDLFVFICRLSFY